MIKGLVFDFDGLIFDTETNEYEVLQQIYKEHGAELPLETWGQCIGTHSNFFDAHQFLEEQIGKKLDRQLIREQRKQLFEERIIGERPLPGVENCLEKAKELGLKIGLASSSHYDWVSRHLRNLNLFDYFTCIRTADDVKEVKPNPELYLQAVKCLGISPHEAIAFEDSANGATAAKRAGLHCVVIPNSVTSHLVFENIDLRLMSMEEVDLQEILNRFSA